MEWDTGCGPPSSSLTENKILHSTPKGKTNKQTYSQVLRIPSNPRQNIASKSRYQSSGQNRLGRSSTEISLRGQKNNPDTSPGSLIKYVIDRQETQINNILAVQSNTIQEIVDKQQKFLQESILHITNSIPIIVTKVLESILPSIITQVKTTLAHDNSDHSSDNL
jgi:hypothetical protein